MLEIRNADGLMLELPADQSITVELNSTIFDTDDVFRGSYSYPFEFGLSPHNCRFIGNSHLPESPVATDMKVSVRSRPFHFDALLTFKTTGNKANASLLIDLGELADQIRNVPVREFVTERFFVTTDETGETPSMRKLATAPPSRYPCVFPPFHNSEMVDAEFKPTENYKAPTIVNVCYPGLPEPVYSNTLHGTGDRLLVPFIYVGWLITYICNKLGFSASGSFFNDPVLSRLVIYNTQTTPGLTVDTAGYTVEIGRHLGEYSISEFFKALRSYIGMSIDFNFTTRKAVFSTYKSLAALQDYTDISSMIVPNTEGVDKNTGKGYNVKVSTDSSDKYVRYHPFPFDSNEIQPKELKTTFSFSVGSKQNEVPLSVGTIRMDSFKSTNDTTPAGPSWLIPAAQQSGNLADPFFEKSANYSPYFDSNDPDMIPPAKNSWGLRMLIYWGLKEDTAGNLYPYASSVSYDSKYRIFGDLSLQPGEPDDIWNRYQKAYYEFLASSKKITVLSRLGLGKLSDISPSKPVGFKLSNQVLGKYILEKLSYRLPSSEGYVMAEFEGRQVVPKTMNATGGYDGKLVTSWVRLVMENRVQENSNENGSIKNNYADIVAYIWKDGLFTEPEPNQGFQIEYRKTVDDYDVNAIPTRKTTKHSVFITGHRTVVESHVLHLVAGNPRGLIKWTTWAMLDGEGYRTR
ncbi:hypothetical protein SAMN04487996_10423 [Dyadobacter soli]|uniref:Uncharacterized protein n=1 Tax=Dyadobacter soli TaxID=659014 RepID=A0A1G7AZQ5_9BACT|nr:hypothetical protein [Dyadobacter soli]SDE20182.1 hypothetical protein SAMN04487996_10423 [Dyadobacter soli]